MSKPTDASHRATTWRLPVAALCVVAAIAWVAIAWIQAQASAGSEPGLRQPATATASEANPASAEVLTPAAAAEAPIALERTDPRQDRTAAPNHSRHAQGLRGIVIDADDRPLGDIDVHLVENAGNDPLLLPLMQQQEHYLAPVASTRTDQDGTFALGLEVVQDKVYEIHVASPRHAISRLTDLRLLPGTWHDLGAIRLDAGATLRGRVTVEGRPAIPVPQATVMVETGAAFADAALRALPGGQGLLVAHVDAAGFYELPRAPTRGVVKVSALSPGFARVVKHDIELTGSTTIQVDFALPPGQSLAGDVHDREGRPIAGARIEAWPKQAGEEPLLAFSDDQGAFVMHGLRPAPHRIRASARGYETQQQQAVGAEQDLHLVMDRRSVVRVIARSSGGEVLRRYRLGLRRLFPVDLQAPLDLAAVRAGNIGAVTEVPEQHVRLDAGTESAEIAGIPAGLFVCEVEADGYAKTLSAPIRCGSPEPAANGGDGSGTFETIEVVVTRGVRLSGRVVDDAGNALADAVVITQGDGSTPDNPLFRMVQGFVPHKITQRTVKTGADGSFVLERLAFADYQLQVDHVDACRTIVRGLHLDAGSERVLPLIRMPSGAIVQGNATVDGRVAGQMKVVLTTTPSIAAEASLRLETITDGEGRYRFTRRIPPGTYELRAAVVGAATPDAGIFQQLLQLKRSATTFSVPPGPAVVERDLDLSSAN